MLYAIYLHTYLPVCVEKRIVRNWTYDLDFSFVIFLKMPSRKKSNLSQYSKNARKMKLIRSQNSEGNYEARLNAARERQARTLASESFNEREIRLSKKRAQMAASRLLESNEEREARLAANRLRVTLSRQFETLTERESRLSSQRARTAAARMLKRIENAQYQTSQINLNQEDFKDSFTSTCYMPQASTDFDTPETTQQYTDGSADDSIRDSNIDYNFSRDQYSIYGENIAHRLRNCQRNNYEIFIAQHNIDDIIFKLSMGLYSPMMSPTNAQINHIVPTNTSITPSSSISIPNTSISNISTPTTSVPDTSRFITSTSSAKTVTPTATIESNISESEPSQCVIVKKELDL